jgi:hypothetical protein
MCVRACVCDKETKAKRNVYGGTAGRYLWDNSKTAILTDNGNHDYYNKCIYGCKSKGLK